MSEEMSVWVTPDWFTPENLEPENNNQNYKIACFEFLESANESTHNIEQGEWLTNNIFIRSTWYSNNVSTNPDYVARILATGIRPYVTLSAKMDQGIFELLARHPDGNFTEECDAIASFVAGLGFEGLDNNTESISHLSNRPIEIELYYQFCEQLGQSLHAQGLKYRFVTTPSGTEWTGINSFDNARLITDIPSADKYVPMMYDEFTAVGNRAGLSTFAFYEAKINALIAEGVPVDKIVVGIPNYGMKGRLDNIWSATIKNPDRYPHDFPEDLVWTRDPSNGELKATDDEFIYFKCDNESVRLKKQFVKDLNLGITQFSVWVAGDIFPTFSGFGTVGPPPTEELSDEIDLSYFIYPHWSNDDTVKGLDYLVERDHPQGAKKVYFEFLHFTDPVRNTITPVNDSVAVAIIDGTQQYWTENPDNLRYGYSKELAHTIKDLVAEPYCTLSGRGNWRGAGDPGNVAWLMNQSQELKSNTIDFIVDFVKYECCFTGINVNVERMALMTPTEVANYKLFLSELVDKAHAIDLKIIITITADVSRNTVDGNSYSEYTHSVDGNGTFNHEDLYDLPVDYWNVMMIDSLWSLGDKACGHFSFEAMKVFLDRAKPMIPDFQNKLICQFSNYGMWGYNQGFFDDSGNVLKTLAERETFANDHVSEDGQLKWMFQILTKPQIDKLLAGDNSWMWRAPQGNVDISWLGTPQSIPGTRLPESNDLVIPLPEGFVLRREYGNPPDMPDQEYLYWKKTVLIWSDQVAIDSRMRYVFDNYGLKKFSMWHGGREMPWFSGDTIRYINDGEIPVYTPDNPCTSRPITGVITRVPITIEIVPDKDYLVRYDIYTDNVLTGTEDRIGGEKDNILDNDQIVVVDPLNSGYYIVKDKIIKESTRKGFGFMLLAFIVAKLIFDQTEK